MTAPKTEDNFYRRAQIEALARTKFPRLKVFEAEDGREFFVSNPLTRSDELIEALEPLSGQVEVARACIEDENGEGSWDAFKAAGGQSWMVLVTIQDEVERQRGKTPGSEVPTT